VKNRLTLLLLGLILLNSALPSLAAANAAHISADDRLFLEKLQEDSFRYFRKFRDSKTGLILDSSTPGSPASIAATGFGLAALGVAKSRGWMGFRDSYEAVNQIVTTLESSAAHKNGFYYHFLDPKTGKRSWSSEVSSIDTALLMTGLLLAGEYFKETDLQARAQKLYERTNWKWMLNDSLLISHGWKPGTGFLPHYWDMYSEHLILQALAIGSPTHPVPAAVWNEWVRYADDYDDQTIVYSFSGSLFTYQYAQAFIDFRNLNDAGINYFDNSLKATRANQAFSAAHPTWYTTDFGNWWGLSASLGPNGYKAYGAKPGVALHDGTIAPYAIASSMMFTPEEAIITLKKLFENYGFDFYGEYGFKDAINPHQNWMAQDYLGINQGMVVIALENYLNDGSVWQRRCVCPS